MRDVGTEDGAKGQWASTGGKGKKMESSHLRARKIGQGVSRPSKRVQAALRAALPAHGLSPQTIRVKETSTIARIQFSVLSTTLSPAPRIMPGTLVRTSNICQMNKAGEDKTR